MIKKEKSIVKNKRNTESNRYTKMKNENTAKLLEQQQNALKEKMEVGQQLEDLKNQNNQLEIDLFNLTNKRKKSDKKYRRKNN